MTRNLPWGFRGAVVLFASAVAFTLVEHVTDWRPRPTRVSASTYGCIFGTVPPPPGIDAATPREPGGDGWYRLDHLGTYGVVRNPERRAVRAEIVATATRRDDAATVTRTATATVVVAPHSTKDWEVSFPRRPGAADPLFAGLPEGYRCTATARHVTFVDG